MKQARVALLMIGAAAVGPATWAAGPAQPVTGPVAVYWMSAATSSGMGGMTGGGMTPGQRPSMAQMMGMASRDPNAPSHSLILQLGSSHRPEGGGPTAEHDPPQVLGVGQMLPLLSPEPQAPAAHEEAEPGPPPQYQQPHGRMLIFWGCGEHAGPGQPYVIDFAKLGQTGGAQQFMALARGLAVTPMRPPSPTRNTTYGEWPNRETRVTVPGDGSLQGDHYVHGNYSPDIRFSLAANQDFLPPIRLTSNEKTPTGSANLAWRPVDGASAYFITMIGSRDRDQVVMWSSSASQTSAFALPDYLSTGEIRRLVANHALLPADATSCVIPQEAMAAAGSSGFFQMAAYGDETNIAYPPRPPAPKPWNIAWEVKVRYRASTAGVVGMDMSRMGMGGREGEEGRPPGDRPPPRRRPNPFNPLGGLGGFIP